MKVPFFAGMFSALIIVAGCFGLVCYGTSISTGSTLPKKEIVYSMAQDVDRTVPPLLAAVADAVNDNAFLEMTKRNRK